MFGYMNILRNILIVLSLSTMLFAASSCTGKGIIPEKKMSKIIAEMYLADQYIDITPQLRNQTDSMLVYQGILQKYGFTQEEYVGSIRYYMGISNKMYKIHSAAKQILMKRKHELDKIAPAAISHPLMKFNTSFNSDNVDTLFKNPLNRAMKWLTAPYSFGKIPFYRIDSSDTPVNAKWWNNNISIQTGEKFVFAKPIETNTVQENDKDRNKNSHTSTEHKKIIIGKNIDNTQLEENLKKDQNKVEILKRKLKKDLPQNKK